MKRKIVALLLFVLIGIVISAVALFLGGDVNRIIGVIRGNMIK